jgi:hypothetical protein
MTEQERLLRWMDNNNFTVWSLGEALGFKSRVSVYRMTRRETLSPNFKLRFISRFGIDVANELFDPPAIERTPEAS